ncbi:MAG: polysaccharide pyruvyl transferase family protein [Pseudomonadota bacterium]
MTKPKTVFLSGAGGMGNIGAEAILLAIIQLLQDYYGKDTRFILAAWHPGRVQTLLCGIAGHFEVHPQSIPFDPPRLLIRADLFVVCGDVALTESVIPLLPLYWAFKSLWARGCGAQIWFVGIEVEPLQKWWNRWAVRRLLDPVTQHYLLRTQDSLDHLRRLTAPASSRLLGCDPVLLIKDDWLVPFKDPAITVSEGELAVGFGIRDHFAEPLRLDWRHMRLQRQEAPAKISARRARHIEILATLANHLVEQHQARLFFIPHHFLPPREQVILTDHQFAERVVAAMRHPERAVLLSEEIHPYAAMNLYRQLDLVVSMRHHANSFAHRFGVPTVGLGVSEKINSFFRQLDLESLVLDPDTLDLDRAHDTLDFAIQNRQNIKAQMQETLTRFQKTMETALQSLSCDVQE